MNPNGETPLTPVGNGRNANGRFGAGNKLAKGNPLNRKVQQYRAALLRAVSAKDMAEVVRKLVEQAKGGDRLAIAELLDRTIGRPVQADVLNRLEALEELIGTKLAAIAGRNGFDDE